MPHAPWHGGGTYEGANPDFNPSVGYTGSGSQSGNQGGDQNESYVSSAPRTTTTFNQGVPSISYSVTDAQASANQADAALENFIRNNQDLKNQNAGLESILQDMPDKRAEFVRRNRRADGSLNSAALAMLNPYLDGRNEYQRSINRLRTSSPAMMQAYARRFPISNFMMESLPKFIPGIGGLAGFEAGRRANKIKQNVLSAPVNVPEGGFKNFVDFFKKNLTDDQAAKINIIEDENVGLQDPNIFTSPQDMGFLEDDPEKVAIEAAYVPLVYDPRKSDFEKKVDFINSSLSGAQYPYESNDPAYYGLITDLFEKVKRNIGYEEIRPTVDANNAQEEAPITGQFDLTDQYCRS